MKPQPVHRSTGGALAVDAPGRRRLPVLLRRAWYGLNQAFRRRIAPLGITPDQFTVLRTLLEFEGLTQRQLADQMTSDANTIAALVRRMETAGLLQRCPHEKDRRAHRLHVTPAGRRAYLGARAAAVAMQSEILRCLPEPSREPFLQQLDIVATACRAAGEQGQKTELQDRATQQPP